MPQFSDTRRTSFGASDRSRSAFLFWSYRPRNAPPPAMAAILHFRKLRLPRRLSAAFRGGNLKAADRYQFTSPAFCCSHPESEGNTVFIDTFSISLTNIGLTVPIHSLKCGASRWA